jgi:hypothetical protein
VKKRTSGRGFRQSISILLTVRQLGVRPDDPLQLDPGLISPSRGLCLYLLPQHPFELSRQPGGGARRRAAHCQDYADENREPTRSGRRCQRRAQHYRDASRGPSEFGNDPRLLDPPITDPARVAATFAGRQTRLRSSVDQLERSECHDGERSSIGSFIGGESSGDITAGVTTR